MKHCQLKVGPEFFKQIVEKRRNSPGEVVMAILRPGGRILLSTKPFYPEDVYRMPSGQIKKGETPDEAFLRELREETGFQVGINRILDTVHFMFEHGTQRADYLSYVILSDETVDDPQPEDEEEDISGFCEVDPCALPGISDRLARLPEPWADWGRFRAPAHEIVHRALCARTADNPGNG